MVKKLFAILLILISTLFLLNFCNTKRDVVLPAGKTWPPPDSVKVEKNKYTTFDPRTTILGNNSFATTVGGITLSDFYTAQIRAVQGRCDTSSGYYIVSGKFELDSNKAYFSAYFKSKPTKAEGDYTLVPYLVETLTDTSSYLIVTEILKTSGKTWRAVKGNLKVNVLSGLPRVNFENITGENISNVSDSTTFSGYIQCK